MSLLSNWTTGSILTLDGAGMAQGHNQPPPVSPSMEKDGEWAQKNINDKKRDDNS